MLKAELQRRWGARLREVRENKRLSQRALGLLVDMSGSGIHRVETGESGIGEEAKIRIAQALGVQVAELFPYPDTTAAVVNE